MAEEKFLFISHCYNDIDIQTRVSNILAGNNLNITSHFEEDLDKNINLEFDINNSDLAIILISGSYLKSSYCLHEGVQITQDVYLKNNCLVILIDDNNSFEDLDKNKYIEYWLNKEKNCDDEIGLQILKDEVPDYHEIQRIRKAREDLNILLSTLSQISIVKYSEFIQKSNYYINKLIDNHTKYMESKYLTNNINNMLVEAKNVVNKSIQIKKNGKGREPEYTEIEKALGYKCFVSWVLTNQGTLNKIFDYNSLMEYCIGFTLNILSTNDIKNNIKKNVRNYEPEDEVKLWREGTSGGIWYNFLTGGITAIAGYLYDLYNYSHESVLNNRDVTFEIGQNVYNIVASNWISEAINIITAEKIDEKLGVKNPSKVLKYESVVPGYSLDDSSGEDKLSIMKDVKALATLIAYNKLNPPLAIGIFGKWGAGKSFFMDKLRFKVEELSKKNEGFCNDVVHVRFNAWYYSDTNLWASMVEKIFNELSNYAKKRGKEKEAGEILFEKLESSKNAILEIQNKLNNVNELKKNLIIKKSKAEKDKSEKISSLKDVKIKDINEIIKTDENIKNDIDSIKKLIDGLLIENIVDIKLNISNINTSIKRVCYAFNIIRKKRGFELIIFIGILLGIPLITFILCKVLVEDINRIVMNLIDISSIALGFISSWKLKLEPIVKNLNIGYARLVNLEESWKSVQEKKKRN